jgi:hypothetical protein
VAATELAFAAWTLGLLRPALEAGPGGEDPARLRDREIEGARIRRRHALALEGDYFEVLGVGRDASPEEIRRAYDLQCREIAPAALGPELTRALVRELEVIREVLEEALRVLGTDSLRARYQAGLPPRRREEPLVRWPTRSSNPGAA